MYFTLAEQKSEIPESLRIPKERRLFSQKRMFKRKPDSDPDQATGRSAGKGQTAWNPV